MEFTVSVLVASDPEGVFRVLTDVERSPEVLPEVKRVEIVSDTRSGLGMKWKETRRMMGRDATVELEIVDWQPPHRLTVRSSVLGTSYESVFSLTPASGGTHLVHDFTSSGAGFVSGLFEKLTAGPMKKSMQADLEAIKAYCEANPSQ